MSSRAWMIFSRRSSDAITFERTCCADSPSSLQSPNLTGIGSASTSWGLSGRGSHRGRLPPAARANEGRCVRGHDGARPGACVACTAGIRRACSSDPCACGVPSEGWLHDSPQRWSPVGAARVGGVGRRPSSQQDALVIAPARRLVARLAALRVRRGLRPARGLRPVSSSIQVCAHVGAHTTVTFGFAKGSPKQPSRSRKTALHASDRGDLRRCVCRSPPEANVLECGAFRI